MISTKYKESQPVTKAPGSNTHNDFVWKAMKAIQIPGRMECATASPDKLFFCKKAKLPTTDADRFSRMVPNTTVRTLGSSRRRKRMKSLSGIGCLVIFCFFNLSSVKV